MSIPVTMGGIPVARSEQLDLLTKAQFILSKTKTMTDEDIINSLGFLIQTEDTETFDFLVRELTAAYIDPTQNTDAILKTILFYCRAYPIFKDEALKLYGTAISDTRKKIYHFRILRYLLKQGIYEINDIKLIISKYPISYENQFYLLILHFTPELETDDPEKFNLILEKIQGFEYLSQTYRSLLDEYIIQPLSTSKFNKHKKWIHTSAFLEYGLEEDSILKKVLAGDENAILSFAKGEFAFSQPPLYPNQFLAYQPHPLMICALFGLIKPIATQPYLCARLKDNTNNPFLVYAAAGGNVAILEILARNHVILMKDQSEEDEEVAIAHPITRELGPLGTRAAVPSSLCPAGTKSHGKNFGALSAAASNRRLDALFWLLENTNCSQIDLNNALIESARANFLAGVRLLVNKGADINCRGYDDETPLHTACENGSIEAAKQILITPGVDVEVKNAKKQTVFHMAAYSGSTRMYKLIEDMQGMDSALLDCYRNSPKTIFESTVKEMPNVL